MLAGMLVSWKRDIGLDVRIAPEGWSFSFRPPERWRLAPGQRGDLAVEFHEVGVSGAERLLIVQEMRNPDALSALEIAEIVRLRWGYPGLKRLFAGKRQPRVRRAPFGPFDGIRMDDDAGGLVLAVGENEDQVFCIGLIGASRPLSKRDIELVDRIVDSVQRVRE